MRPLPPKEEEAGTKGRWLAARGIFKGIGGFELYCGSGEENKRQEKRAGTGKKEEEKSYQLRQRLQVLLELPLSDPEQKEILKNAGLPMRYRDRLQLVAWNLYQKALAGDLAAIRELRSIMGEGKMAKEKGRREGPDREGRVPVIIVDDVR